MPTYLGIDYGSARIGLAISDMSARIAMPAEVIRGRNNPALDAAAVWEAAQEHEADCFIIGLPLNMNGTEGPQARLSRRFGAEVARLSGKPVDYQDERLTSAAAESLLHGQRRLRGRERKPIDNVAAQIMLQTFLDRRLPES